MSSALSEWKRNYTDPGAIKPRAKIGLQLYAQGVVPTLREASAQMGFHPQYLTILANTPAGKAYMASAHEIIRQGITNKQQLISALSQRAIEVAGTLMEDAKNEVVRLKAATDLMDRDPEVSKVQKHQVESFTLGGKDAKEIAAALVQSASVHERYAELRHGDFNKLEAGETIDATEARIVEGGSQQEHQAAEEGRVSAEASGGDLDAESREASTKREIADAA